MILKAKFTVDKSRLQFEVEMIWDSDIEVVELVHIIHIPIDINDPYSGSMIVRQPMDRTFSDITGCDLLDFIGDYNKRGELLDVQLVPYREYFKDRLIEQK